MYVCMYVCMYAAAQLADSQADNSHRNMLSSNREGGGTEEGNADA